MADVGCELLCLLVGELQVLGGECLGERERCFEVFRVDFHVRCEGVEECVVVAHCDGQVVFVVFGLGFEVGAQGFGVGVLVGDHG